MNDNSSSSSDLRELRGTQQDAWQRDERVLVETLLGQSSDQPLAEDVVLKLILSEYQLREELAEHPTVAEYVARFPDLAEQLQHLFAVHATLQQRPSESSELNELLADVISPADAALEGTLPFPQQAAKQLDAVSTERHLLFAVLAFESDLLDLPQLTAACRAWVADKSQPLADLLVQRGWINAEDRAFIDKQLERKLAKHQDDPRVTLNAITRGDVCDALKQLGDADIDQSLSTWPPDGPVLLGPLGEPSADSSQPNSRYTWLSEVGKGGLGKVWLARDNDLVREVALKEVKPGSGSRDAIRMLIKEAQITGQLQHPNIVPVYEVNRGGRPFYTMKLVKGETLSAAIKQHHAAADNSTGEQAALELSMQRLMSVFLNVCDALAYAHSRGVIHRDLKPLNIVLGDYGEAIVLDWGLARKLDQTDDDLASIRITGDAQTEATQAGSVMGSPPYMAPEQAAGQVDRMDQRTDVYGLGAILFEILTGRAPHRKTDNESIVSLLRRITLGDTPHVRELDPSLPEELDSICAKAMGKTRDERYQTAKDLKAALLEFQVHKESIELAASASSGLDQARQTNDYQDFSRALFGFEEALRQWPANTRAADGLQETRTAYAESAFQRGDYDLALSLLEPSRLGTLARPSDGQECPSSNAHEPPPNQTTLRTKIQLAATERASRQTRIRRLRRFSIAASLTAAVVLILGTVVSTYFGVQASRAAQRAARDAYVANVRLAATQWDNGTVELASESLEACRPQSGQSDLRGWEWNYLWNLSHTVLATLEGHAGGVWSVNFSPDGTRIVSASDDHTARVWDMNTGKELLTLRGHSSEVKSVNYSPDGTRIVSGSEDHTIIVWDAQTGDEMLTLKGHLNTVWSARFSPDGKTIVSGGGKDGGPRQETPVAEIKIWDAQTGQEMLNLKGHLDVVYSVNFSPNGSRIVSGSEDKTVKVWDVHSGKVLTTLQAESAVMGVGYSPDGNQIACCEIDHKTIKVWDTDSGQVRFTLNGHSSVVYNGVSFSPDGKQIVTGSGRTIKFWDAKTGEEIRTLKGHSDGVLCVAFSPDGRRIVSGSADKTMMVWAASGKQATEDTLSTLEDKHPLRLLSLYADGSRIVTGDNVKTITVWDAASCLPLLKIKGHSAAVWCASVSPDGKLIVGCSGTNPDAPAEFKIWDAVNGLETQTFNGHAGIVFSVSFSPNGKQIVSSSSDKTAKVWDASSGKELLTLQGHSGFVVSAVFSPDGKRVVTGAAALGQPGEIKIWDALTGKELLNVEGHSDGVMSVTYSQDGQRLVSGSADRTIKVWNAHTGRSILTLTGHSNQLTKVSFSPDGQRILSSSTDRTIKVWESQSGRELLTLTGTVSRHSPSDKEPVRFSDVRFSSDGFSIVGSSEEDGIIRIWDGRFESKSLIRLIEQEAKRAIHLHRKIPTGRDELITALRGDQTLSESARQKAITWANLLPPGSEFDEKSGTIKPLTQAEKRQLGMPLKSDAPKPPVPVVDLSSPVSPVLPAPPAPPMDADEELRRKVVELGGSAEVTGNRELTSLNLSGNDRVTDSSLSFLKNSQHLRSVSLEQMQQLDGSCLEFLSNLTEMRAIAMGGNRQVGGDQFRHLKLLTKLDALFLVQTGFDDASCGHIRHLQELHLLDIGETKVTDAGLCELAQITSLGDLNLTGTAVTDTGIGELQALTNLNTLRLSGTGVTDAGLKPVSGLSHLQSLNLDRTAVSDQGLLQLITLADLVTLTLSETSITDAGLKHLQSITSLRHVVLHNTKVTRAGIDSLQAALPNCNIEHAEPDPVPEPEPAPDPSEVSNDVNADRQRVIEINSSGTLTASSIEGRLVITASNITIDGGGLTLVGGDGNPKTFTGTAISAHGVSNVTLKNFNVRGWETGLKIVDGEGWTVENCNFSGNFHDPEFGWGENGRRGGMVLEGVRKSTLRKNRANNVWDACVLVDSDENTLEDNDFSHTSNTCLTLWHASNNVVRRNVLSHGIRISPGEVHARDSTSVLIESGSNQNHFLDNDCTHGGDGIFVRVLNGWCSTDNLFENNDCSYANNNGFECWAPRNTFVRNKANHCSYGFWLGGSDQTRLEGNEASFNGLPDGFHNSPHLPDDGHAGIVFMFGSSSHIFARGNICIGNNGAGIAAVGDLDSQGAKWKAYHWIIEDNTLAKNRWGVYTKFADWISVRANRFDDQQLDGDSNSNSVADVQSDPSVTRIVVDRTPLVDTRGGGILYLHPKVNIEGPASAYVGESVGFNLGLIPDPEDEVAWDFGDGTTAETSEVGHRFTNAGFYRIGVNVSNIAGTDLAWRDFYVLPKLSELTTEGQSAEWTWLEEPNLAMSFRDDETVKIAGGSSVSVAIDPYHGGRANLLVPKSRSANWSLAGKKKLIFWLKVINPNLPGWQDVNPIVTLYESDQKFVRLTPNADLLSQPTYNEAREGWRYFEIPLAGDNVWASDVTDPALAANTKGSLSDDFQTIRFLTIGVDSWGGEPLQIWVDGLGWL